MLDEFLVIVLAGLVVCVAWWLLWGICVRDDGDKSAKSEDLPSGGKQQNSAEG